MWKCGTYQAISFYPRMILGRIGLLLALQSCKNSTMFFLYLFKVLTNEHLSKFQCLPATVTPSWLSSASSSSGLLPCGAFTIRDQLVVALVQHPAFGCNPLTLSVFPIGRSFAAATWCGAGRVGTRRRWCGRRRSRRGCLCGRMPPEARPSASTPTTTTNLSSSAQHDI
ncbi:hypothetical protein GUJ93_ZPchr0009g1048 [Zizania palustris]|uniref:Uncharacterized protein n=1 Tax=Zizania palustris TaxID=103762 RepID=A0A8J5S733_ZIZPA|nr:hypothetical protein GUJ93_ZPchr0009g1048 [Zizania palustris]KAG8051050.1 hypothetical protein GUJ93_ZPchr0009g1048 [Zizania palustris]KAG8051051.1 hypothetical protein GUJ93_ZPchr0009g1048 [Zizania palustris]